MPYFCAETCRVCLLASTRHIQMFGNGRPSLISLCFTTMLYSAGKDAQRWARISFMTNSTSGTTPSGVAAWVRRREADCCYAWPALSRCSRVTSLRWEPWWMCSVESLATNPLSLIYWRLLSFRIVIMRTFYGELWAPVNYIYPLRHPHTGCEKVLRPVRHQRGAEVFPGSHEGAAAPGPPSGLAFNGLTAGWEVPMISEWDLLER